MKLRIAAVTTVMLLAGCRHSGDLTAENGGGVYAVRSTCPLVGVPAGTGDVTVFNPSNSTDSRAIDISATITDVRSTCQDAGADVVSTATFTVVALRRDPGPARQVILPYFNVALRGGGMVVAKRVGSLALNFPAGSVHAWTRAQATIRVNRSAATLPVSVRRILTQPRRAGEAEAATDPLADPSVRNAVANATFEHLVGFQMTQNQLRYNATR